VRLSALRAAHRALRAIQKAAREIRFRAEAASETGESLLNTPALFLRGYAHKHNLFPMLTTTCAAIMPAEDGHSHCTTLFAIISRNNQV
jgi:hypothetical protein